MTFWRKQPILRGYVSEIDHFLQELDQRPDASSTSRRAEELKYELISEKRDHASANVNPESPWKDF